MNCTGRRERRRAPPTDLVPPRARKPWLNTSEGPAGRYFDGDHDGLGESPFITFEIERLRGQGERGLVPLLSYLFHRIDKRLDGRLTRITADELWIMLAWERFAGKFEEWLRTCRKKNAAVVLSQ